MNNRELKFRAWNKAARKMLQPVGIGSMGEVLGNHEEFIGNHTLMQFTGLKDKNGKDIFEGDIIEGINNFSSFWTFKPLSDAARAESMTQAVKGIVEMYNGAWVVRHADGGFNLLADLGLNDASRDKEDKRCGFSIIGNVWENQLLK